jgi:hypothetical protein
LAMDIAPESMSRVDWSNRARRMSRGVEVVMAEGGV